MTKPTGVAPQDVFLSAVVPAIGWRKSRYGRWLLSGLFALTSSVVLLPIAPVLAKAPCTVMQRGDRNDSVKALQQTLLNNGYDGVGVADGIFGTDTEIAVILFQRKNNLDPDGVVGAATCAALLKLTNNQLTAFVANPAPPANTPTTSTSTTTKPTSTSSTTTSTPTSNNTTTSTTTNGDRTLQKGDNGADVVVLQNALRARGFTSLVVTGTYDQATEDTVKRLQSLENIPQTGVMDKLTRDRLNAYLNAQGTTGTPPTTQPPTSVDTSRPPANPAPAVQTIYVPPAPITTGNDVAFSSPNQNTTTRGNSIYVVAVPLRSNGTLAQVRQVVPQASLDRSRQGSFVNAGSYRNRYEAESLSNSLKARGLDARVFVP